MGTSACLAQFSRVAGSKQPSRWTCTSALGRARRDLLLRLPSFLIAFAPHLTAPPTTPRPCQKAYNWQLSVRIIRSIRQPLDDRKTRTSLLGSCVRFRRVQTSPARAVRWSTYANLLSHFPAQ